MIRRFTVGDPAQLAAWEAEVGRARLVELAATPCFAPVSEATMRDQLLRKTIDDPHMMGCVPCLCRFWLLMRA